MYQFTFYLSVANPVMPVKFLSNGVSIHTAVVEVLPAKAKAKMSALEGHDECRIHFPYIAHGLLRDQFGNVSPSDGAISIKLNGCSLQDSDAKIFCESGATFAVIFVPRRHGEVTYQVMVNGELLSERNLSVRPLSSWTKEDASQWVQTLAPIDAAISAPCRALGQEFLVQNVTGAKIAGGLLDRGALHFAFHIEDTAIADFFASVISDLNQGSDAPKYYCPWSWTSPGVPACLSPVDPENKLFNLVVDRLRTAIPQAKVTSIKCNENAAVYEKYFQLRNCVGFGRGSVPNERYLWYCGEKGASVQEILETGFSASALRKMKNKDHMVLGRGFYFAPDAKVADLSTDFEGQAAGKERTLILARVTCGSIASKELLTSKAGGQGLKQELEKPSNCLPPSGFQSATSPTRTLLVSYFEHAAYPEFAVSYSLPYKLDASWPETKPGSFFTLEEVKDEI